MLQVHFLTKLESPKKIFNPGPDEVQTLARPTKLRVLPHKMRQSYRNIRILPHRARQSYPNNRILPHKARQRGLV